METSNPRDQAKLANDPQEGEGRNNIAPESRKPAEEFIDTDPNRYNADRMNTGVTASQKQESQNAKGTAHQDFDERHYDDSDSNNTDVRDTNTGP